eukprot:EG_transcript_13988
MYAHRRTTEVPPPTAPRPALHDLLSEASPSTPESPLHGTSDDQEFDTAKSQASTTTTTSSSGGGGSRPRPSGPLPTSRFPVSTKGRCHHRVHWLRLRGKRGHTYFLCTKCLCGWRKPRDPQAPEGDEPLPT